MSVFIPVPGVAQAVLTWHIGPHKANNVLHFNIGSVTSWNSGNLLTLCNTIMGTLKTGLQPSLPTGTTFNGVAAVDLSTQSPASAISNQAAWAGTISGTPNPSACLMLNLVIGYRYRGGHPRVYFPGPSSTLLSAGGDTWGTVAQNAYQAAWNSMSSAIATAIPPVVPCVPIYNYSTTVETEPPKVTHDRVSLKNVFGVQGANPSAPIRSQRRRITAAS